MKGKFLGCISLLAALLTGVSCNRHRTSVGSDEVDTLEVTDSVECDSLFFITDEDEGLSYENRETEVFGDFIFAFTHNGRFQAERIRFPLPVTDIDGTERVIRSGRQFREEFQLPGNDYYTLILGDRDQADILQNDSILTDVSFQKIKLQEMTMMSYNFHRTDGRWQLVNRVDSHIDPQLTDFMLFYNQFTTDSLFQQESVARHLAYTTEDPDLEDGDIEGTIERGQWPAFRPEMPCGEFVNIYFGQPYPNPHHICLMQCGISNSMLDIFIFRKEGERWQLTSYEN